jgi:hypothetical protein
MEQRYDIRTKLTEPSEERIAAHRDFDALLERFQNTATPAPEATPAKVVRFRPWLYPVLSTAAAVALLLVAYFAFYPRAGAPLDSTEYFAAQPYVDPPVLTGAEPTAYRVQTVNNVTGGELVLPSGARLVIPEYAFATDRGGQPVAGEVLIHYRELLDFVDFFQAGIPMEYDDPEQLRYLDPAGIVDIYAEQDGRRLNLIGGKPVEVSFTSAVQTGADGSLPQLSVYYLDETARRWVYQGLDRVTDLTEGADRVGSFRTVPEAVAQWESTNPAPVPPVAPRATAGDNPTLQLDFLNDLALAPGSDIAPSELRAINASGIWEILPETGAVNANAFDVTWEQVRLNRLGDGKYELTLIHPQNELRLVVQPVLSATELQQAREAYQSALVTYRADSAAWADELAAVRVQAAQELTTGSSDPAATKGEKHTVRHHFTIDTLGLYTVARTVQPELRPARLSLRDRSGRIVNQQPVYVVNSGGNTIYRYLAGDPNRPAIPAAGDNLLWTVDPQGRLSTFRLPEGVDLDERTLESEKGSTQTGDPRRVLRF